jgi:protein TonB
MIVQTITSFKINLVMDVKKNARVDLEKKRHLFFKTGLLFSLVVVFAAFEWQIVSHSDGVKWEPVAADPEIRIPVTREQPLPPPPPPAAGFNLEIVDNETFIDIPSIKVDVETAVGNPLTHFTPVELTVEDEAVYDPGFIDYPPKMNGFREYIAKNLVYPQEAIDNGIEGTVIIQFVIDREGNVSEVQVIRNVDPLLDNEALRLIRQAPSWTPGMKNGKKVNVRYSFPVKFRLH